MLCVCCRLSWLIREPALLTFISNRVKTSLPPRSSAVNTVGQNHYLFGLEKSEIPFDWAADKFSGLLRSQSKVCSWGTGSFEAAMSTNLSVLKRHPMQSFNPLGFQMLPIQEALKASCCGSVRKSHETLVLLCHDVTNHEDLSCQRNHTKPQLTAVRSIRIAGTVFSTPQIWTLAIFRAIQALLEPFWHRGEERALLF